MERFFCANASQCVNEDPIGTATLIDTYVLLECPQPWANLAWDSKWIPAPLKEAVTQLQAQHPRTRCLLINQEQTRFRRHKSLIIYQRQSITQSTSQSTSQSNAFVGRFNRYEFTIKRSEDAIVILQDFFAKRFSTRFITRPTQDILVCTHGSHDQCCARYGNPFYTQAKRVVRSIDGDIQVWRCSHFGGHRFAPTAITFPDGRNYARLDSSSLKSILSRSGAIELIKPIYRGSTLIPVELQVLERSLLLRFGWDWMKTGISYKTSLLNEADPNAGKLAQIKFQLPDQLLTICQAQIVPDLDKCVTLRASCNTEKESTYTKYRVQNLTFSSLVSIETTEPVQERVPQAY